MKFEDKNASKILSFQEEGFVAKWTPSKIGLYPFGRNVWTIDGDVCGFNTGDEVTLTLSVCSTGQYTCDDGICIDLKKRCDLKVDCDDFSDEKDCSLVELPKGYSTTIPPPPLVENNPLPIGFTLNIISFPSIKTQDLTFEVMLDFHLIWQDVRLDFINLKDHRSLNVLDYNAVKTVWSPLVFFSNAMGNKFTNLEQGSRIECVKQGKPVPSGPNIEKEGSSQNLFSYLLFFLMFLYFISDFKYFKDITARLILQRCGFSFYNKK